MRSDGCVLACLRATAPAYEPREVGLAVAEARGKSAQENVLMGADGQPIMKLVAIADQAHWNWKPEAAYLWEFFKDLSR